MTILALIGLFTVLRFIGSVLIDEYKLTQFRCERKGREFL